MDKLSALNILLDVAQTGGFSKSAKRLGVATSSVTRAIDALEAQLGAALLTRGSHSVNLTDAGRAYVDQVAKVIEDLAMADESIGDTGEEAAGTLRITVPSTYSRVVLASHLAAFLQQHPRIVLDIVVTDRYCDLALERIDLAIRIGQPARDRQLVTRQLAAHDYGVVATPGYLAGTGVPHEPAALKEHECLCLFDHLGRTSAMAVAYGSADAPTAAVSAASSVASHRTPLRARWNFERGVTTQSVNVHGRLLANSLEIVFEGVLAHRGVALLPCWLIERHVRQRHLQRLFTAFDVSPHQGRSVVYAAHLPNRRHSTKVRVFTEFLAARLASFQVF